MTKTRKMFSTKLKKKCLRISAFVPVTDTRVNLHQNKENSDVKDAMKMSSL